MKKSAVMLAALVAVALPATASGQISVGARAGTLGLGGEVSVGLGRMLAVRGGIGVVPYEFESEFSDIEYTVSFPDRIWNVGVDLYPFGGGFRISGGVLNRPKFEIEATGQQQAEVGGRTYTGDIDIQGSFSNERETAPYATIGFGRATGRGFGIYLDVGAAMTGDAVLELTGTCKETTTGNDCPGFQADLERERAQAETDINDLGTVVKLHPIFQIGIRIGL